MPFTDYANYVGLVVFLFAVFAVALVRSRFVWFLVLVIAATTFVSFGKYFPLVYNPLFKWLPYFDKFRVPVMVLIVQHFAFALLFAIGLAAVLKSEKPFLKTDRALGDGGRRRAPHRLYSHSRLLDRRIRGLGREEHHRREIAPPSSSSSPGSRERFSSRIS